MNTIDICQNQACSDKDCSHFHPYRPKYDVACKRGKACTVPNCWYTHPEGRPSPPLVMQFCPAKENCTNPMCRKIHPERTIVGFEPKQSKKDPKITPCKYGVTCNNQHALENACPYDHLPKRIPCMFGAGCRRLHTCLYHHPNYKEQIFHEGGRVSKYVEDGLKKCGLSIPQLGANIVRGNTKQSYPMYTGHVGNQTGFFPHPYLSAHPFMNNNSRPFNV